MAIPPDEHEESAMTQPNCTERLPEHLTSRLSDFQALTTLAQHYGETTPEIVALAEDQDLDVSEGAEEVYEQAQERIYEYPLAVTTLRVHRIELSTGGPGDWLEALVDEDGDITRIVYHFNDWFDHAEKTLEGAEYDTAEAFVMALIPEL
jgi:hypothetical protein